MPLAVSYLACYYCREAVMATDFVAWATSGKLPMMDAPLRCKDLYEVRGGTARLDHLEGVTTWRVLHLISACLAGAKRSAAATAKRQQGLHLVASMLLCTGDSTHER